MPKGVLSVALVREHFGFLFEEYGFAVSGFDEEGGMGSAYVKVEDANLAICFCADKNVPEIRFVASVDSSRYYGINEVMELLRQVDSTNQIHVERVYQNLEGVSPLDVTPFRNYAPFLRSQIEAIIRLFAADSYFRTAESLERIRHKRHIPAFGEQTAERLRQAQEHYRAYLRTKERKTE